ncbi:hypothetical protein FRC16_010684 [Serendipita sp. 398]|nr:hypothetical protein FRC16_010684 [Serendipita sp. 398]
MRTPTHERHTRLACLCWVSSNQSQQNRQVKRTLIRKKYGAGTVQDYSVVCLQYQSGRTEKTYMRRLMPIKSLNALTARPRSVLLDYQIRTMRVIGFPTLSHRPRLPPAAAPSGHRRMAIRIPILLLFLFS